MTGDPGLAHIARWIAASAPAATAVEVDRIGPAQAFDALEEAAIIQAVPRRRDEFLTGRHLARRALVRLGCSPTSLPPDKHRVPRWPEGFLGTISHAGGLCVAQVARAGDLVGLGVDIEEAGRLTADLTDMICRPDERSLEETGGRLNPMLARFVAKEAFFKAYFPAARTFLDFCDVRITFNLEEERFEAELANEASPALCGARRFVGRLAAIGHIVIAGVWIQR